ncbi:MAG: hypothetical protein HZC05_01425 [Candidatus Magasanikbacteria bacterium]|nr:hypothetical protein [Candidatus Magasanikbacteria bacterium]
MKMRNFKIPIFIGMTIVLIFFSARPVQAEETTSTPEITIPTQEIATSTATSTPGLSINFFLRYQDSFLFSGAVTSTATSSLMDTAGSHSVNASSSPLTILTEADALSDNFSISQLDYYDAYQSFYLNCLVITAPTSTSACGNWNYSVNGSYPSIGMDSYGLQNNDTVYIYFDDSWKITATTSTFPINTTTTLQTWRYNYDNLDDEWTLDRNDTVDISIPNPNQTGWWDTTITTTTLATNASGTVEYAFSATGTYFAKITSTDYSKWSWPITLTVLPAPETPTSTATSTPETDTNTGGGGGGGSLTPTPTISSADIAAKTQSILNFLKTQQSADGKIIDASITDWAIMSFGANNQYADEIAASSTSLLNFAKGYNFTDESDLLNLCASYPRHTLAFLASGMAGSDNTVQNLISKIKSAECYKNNKYGLNGINDDVFALFALLATDTPANELIANDILATIIADQTADGAFTWAGWASADITGAAVNALQYAKNKGATIDQNIFTKAKAYLKSQQLADGGWGFGVSDPLTTGWAMMGVNSLNEGQTDWTNSQNKNPWSVLTEQLKTDGYYESAWAPGIVDWFGTKHAVPALLGKSWPIILTPKPQPTPAPANSGGVGGSVGSILSTPIETASSTATSTLPITATSTLAMTSSTLPVISEPIEIIALTPTSSAEEIVKNALPSSSVPDIIKPLKLSPTPTAPAQSTIISQPETPAMANITNSPPETPSPIAPLEKKVATTTATGSAILFAGATIFLFGRLLLTFI